MDINVTGPKDILDDLYAGQLKTLVERIEKHLQGRPHITEYDRDHYATFMLAKDEWVEVPVQAEIKRLYMAAGWLSVSFRYFGEIRFYLHPKITTDEVVSPPVKE